MNNEQLRRQSEIDSRRVSTGVVCRVIREADPKGDDNKQDMALGGLLKLLWKHGYFPDNVSGFPFDTGIHSVNGIAFVLPRHMLDFFEQEIAQMVKDRKAISDEEDTILMKSGKKPPEGQLKDKEFKGKNSDTQLRDMKIRQKRVEQNLLHNLADNIFMATVDPKSNGEFPLTGDIFDIFVNTREQQESLSILIRRDEDPPDESVNKEWTKEVEESDKEEAEARKKWRTILRSLDEKYKAKARKQQEEEINENGR